MIMIYRSIDGGIRANTTYVKPRKSWALRKIAGFVVRQVSHSIGIPIER